MTSFTRTAVVFDLDGTLVDTAPDLAAAMNAALRRHGRPAVALDSVRHMVGDGARKLLMRGFEDTGGLPGDAVLTDAMQHFLDYYGENISAGSQAFPGLLSTLAALRRQGCVFGVCTNKFEGFSRKLLADIGIIEHFAAVVGGDTLTVRKPDPAHILATVERMGARLETAVMVGDSATDVRAARAAGVPVVAVSFGYTAIPAHELGADHVIDSLSELPAVLARLT
jgi:phosphoglycolate phosphatase